VELLIRIAFWLIFGGMLVMQVYFSYRLRLIGDHTPADGTEVKREGSWPTIVRLIRSAALAVFLVLYALDDPLLRALALPLHDWLRWMGVALGILSLVLYGWSRLTLGSEWSSKLRFQEKHQLITIGPYTWVRHPIYLSLLIFMTGISLVTANWVLIVFLAVSFMDLMLRIPKEEQMMIEKFGEEYEAYMIRTGKLIPK
jgi:protein-S-isoprenylcysteine O-methyltransferase Ste14